MNADADFSTFNFEYFLKVRDLALKDAETVATRLGVSQKFTHIIRNLDAGSLAELSRIKQPLVVPHQEQWWWERLLTALHSGRQAETKIILEQASIITSKHGGY